MTFPWQSSIPAYVPLPCQTSRSCPDSSRSTSQTRLTLETSSNWRKLLSSRLSYGHFPAFKFKRLFIAVQVFPPGQRLLGFLSLSLKVNYVSGSCVLFSSFPPPAPQSLTWRKPASSVRLRQLKELAFFGVWTFRSDCSAVSVIIEQQ